MHDEGIGWRNEYGSKVVDKTDCFWKKEFAEVPGRLKEQVRELLLNTEFEVLTKE